MSLALKPGSYAASRLDRRVVRIDGFDTTTGEFMVTDAEGRRRAI